MTIESAVVGWNSVGLSTPLGSQNLWRPYKNLDFRCPGIHAQSTKVDAITDKGTQHTCNTFPAITQPMSLKPTKEKSTVRAFPIRKMFKTDRPSGFWIFSSQSSIHLFQ